MKARTALFNTLGTAYAVMDGESFSESGFKSKPDGAGNTSDESDGCRPLYSAYTYF
jgi:hypothetical protein